MRESKTIISAFIAVFAFPQLYSQANSGGVQSFDGGWLFHKGDTSSAEQSFFNTTNWRTVDLPHDRSIGGSYDRGNATSRGGVFYRAALAGTGKAFAEGLQVGTINLSIK